jgi:NDMA-dependent alcohol dehydrogenase
MKKMRAAVLREVGKPLSLEEVELDPPKEHEVLVRIVATGICHSDYSVVHGVLRSPLPVVLGHEAAGIVEEVGPGVREFAPGDHVIASLTPACGLCPMCREEKPFLCHQTVATMGFSTMVDGTTRLRAGGKAVHQLCAIASFAEYAVIPEGSLVKVDGDVPLETVCLVGCGVTTGVGAALNTARVAPGTSVAVIGCGGVGLSIVQGARIAGAKTIVAIDPVVEKRTLALSLGATHVLDPSENDPVKSLRDICAGGVHYAFEALGRTQTIEQAWAMTRASGLAVVVGVPKVSDELKLRVGGFLQQKAIMGSAYGSAVPRRDIPRFLDLYRKGELVLDAMITSRIRLESVNEALDAMGRGEGARSVVVFDA